MIFAQSFSLLSKSSRRFFNTYVICQLTLAFLDLVGVAILGLVASISINQVSNKGNSDIATKLLSFTGLGKLGLELQVMVLVLTAIVLMVSKSFLALKITWLMLSKLNSEGNALTSSLLRKYFSNPTNGFQGATNQELLSKATAGSISVTVGIVGSGANILGDMLLLVVLIAGLLVVSPTVTLVSVVFFGVVSAVLNRLIHSKSRNLGFEIFNITHLSSTKIVELLSSRRELWTTGKYENRLEQVIQERRTLSSKNLELSLLPIKSKYIIESALLVGAAVFAGLEFNFATGTHAITALSVFLASSSRIAPALLRVQQSLIIFTSSTQLAKDSIAEITSLEPILSGEFQIQGNGLTRINPPLSFLPTVVIENLSFGYEKSNLIIKDLNLRIETGDFVGIFGPSGAGKSTILDLILGINLPNHGGVKVSGLDPEIAIKSFPGEIAYVPQQTFITQGSVADNIAFGLEKDEQDQLKITESINSVDLENWLTTMPNGIHEIIYENGKNLSGGQKQKIGMARALYSNPQLLLLDECTSSLDLESEEEILNSLRLLKGKKTIISVTHNLSSIRDADKILYIGMGFHVFGTLAEVKRIVPDFEKQALSLGL